MGRRVRTLASASGPSTGSVVEAKQDPPNPSASKHIDEDVKTFKFGEGGVYDRLRAKFLHLFAHTELRYKDPDTFFNCNSLFRSQPHGFLMHYVDGVLRITPLEKDKPGITVSKTDSVLVRRFIIAAFQAAQEYTDPSKKNLKEDHEKIFADGRTGRSDDKETVYENSDILKKREEITISFKKIESLINDNGLENYRNVMIWTAAVAILNAMEMAESNVPNIATTTTGRPPTNSELQKIKEMVQSAFQETNSIDLKMDQYLHFDTMPDNSNDLLHFLQVAGVIMDELVKCCESSNSKSSNTSRNVISQGLELQKIVQKILGLQSYTERTVESLETKLKEIQSVLNTVGNGISQSETCEKIIAQHDELLSICQNVQKSHPKFDDLYLELFTDLEKKGQDNAAKFIDTCMDFFAKTAAKPLNTITAQDLKTISSSYHTCCHINAIFSTGNRQKLDKLIDLYKRLHNRFITQFDMQIKANGLLVHQKDESERKHAETKTALQSEKDANIQAQFEITQVKDRLSKIEIERDAKMKEIQEQYETERNKAEKLQDITDRLKERYPVEKAKWKAKSAGDEQQIEQIMQQKKDAESELQKVQQELERAQSGMRDAETKMQEVMRDTEEKLQIEIEARVQHEALFVQLYDESQLMLANMETQYSEKQETLSQEVQKAREESAKAKEDMQKLQQTITEKGPEDEAEKSDLRTQLNTVQERLTEREAHLEKLQQVQENAKNDNNTAIREKEEQIAKLRENLEAEKRAKTLAEESLQSSDKLLNKAVADASERKKAQEQAEANAAAATKTTEELRKLLEQAKNDRKEATARLGGSSTDLARAKEREKKLQKLLEDSRKEIKVATNGSLEQQDAAKAAQATAEAELNKVREDAREANENLEKSKKETKEANDKVDRLTESLKSKEAELAKAQQLAQEKEGSQLNAQPTTEFSQRPGGGSNSSHSSDEEISDTSSVNSENLIATSPRAKRAVLSDVLNSAMASLESDDGSAHSVRFTDSAAPILKELTAWNIDEDTSKEATQTHINNVNRLVCQCQEKDIQSRLSKLQAFITTKTVENPIMQLFNYDKESDVITWNAWGNLVESATERYDTIDESSFNEAPFFPNFSDVVWHDRMPGFRPCRGDESELQASRKTLLNLLKIIAQSSDEQKADFLQKPYVGISALTEGVADMPLVATRQGNDEIVICHELSDGSKIDYMKTFRMNGNIYNTLQNVSNANDDAIQQEILRQASEDNCFRYLKDVPTILPSYIDSEKLDIGQFFGMFLTPGRRLQLDENYMTCIKRILFEQNQDGSLKIAVNYNKLKIEEGKPSYIPNPYDQETGLKLEGIQDFIEKIFTAGIYGNDRPTVLTFILNDILKTTETIFTKLKGDMGIFCNADTYEVKVHDSNGSNENSDILKIFTKNNATSRLEKKSISQLEGEIWVDLGDGNARILGQSLDGKQREINEKPPGTTGAAAEISAAPTAMPTSAQCFPTCSATPYASPPMHFCGVCAPCQDLAARMAYGSARPGSDWGHNPFRAPAAGETYGQYRAPSVTPRSCVPPQMGYRPQQMVRGCPPMAPQGACTYMQCPQEMPWMPVHAGGVRGIDRRAYYVGLGMH